jgi:DNA-binding NtrC family response regulator
MPKANILFADNDPDFLKTRAEFLEQEGYRVIPATDPTEARRKLESGGIDLAIIDIRLSDDDDEKDASGLILAKESDRTVPKIILTGFPSVDAVREALKPQLDGLPAAVEFVSKQEGPEVLLTAAEKALSSGGYRATEPSAKEAGQPKAWKSRKDWIRLAGGIGAIVTLLLAFGTGIISIVAGDPRWLLATILFAILMVIGIGLAIFMPE